MQTTIWVKSESKAFYHGHEKQEKKESFDDENQNRTNPGENPDVERAILKRSISRIDTKVREGSHMPRKMDQEPRHAIGNRPAFVAKQVTTDSEPLMIFSKLIAVDPLRGMYGRMIAAHAVCPKLYRRLLTQQFSSSAFKRLVRRRRIMAQA